MKEALAVLLLIATSFAQTRSSQPGTFKSRDGTFLLHYPKSLVLCQPQYQKSDPENPADDGYILTRWSPDSCNAMLPICPGADLPVTASGPLHPEPVVCIAYPNSAYEGTWFLGAAFSVSTVSDAPTEGECFEDRAGAQKTHWENIGRLRFKASLNGDAGMSHSSVHYVYLGFHNGQCYDLELRMSYVTSTCCDPEDYKKMNFKDDEKVHKTLQRVLKSFRFLK